MNKMLKARIVEKYGNQFGFAVAAGIHESLVSKVIQGRRNLNGDEQYRWAKILGTDPNEIFQGDQKIPDTGILTLASKWEDIARRKWTDAKIEKDPMGKRLIEHGANCYQNCALELREALSVVK